MFKIVYLPDPTGDGFIYDCLYETKEAAQNFLLFWEGNQAYLWEVVEV